MSRSHTNRGRHKGHRSPEARHWAEVAELEWLKIAQPEPPVAKPRKAKPSKPKHRPKPTPQSAPPRPAWLDEDAYGKLIALRGEL